MDKRIEAMYLLAATFACQVGQMSSDEMTKKAEALIVRIQKTVPNPTIVSRRDMHTHLVTTRYGAEVEILNPVIETLEKAFPSILIEKLTDEGDPNKICIAAYEILDAIGADINLNSVWAEVSCILNDFEEFEAI